MFLIPCGHSKKRVFTVLAWVVALVATGGSLYFSEVVGYTPCKLCWIQRIFMYPLVVFLAVANLRKERAIYQYVLPLTITGGLVSLYHYLKQKLPALQNVASSCGREPCTEQYINWFGFVTIPFLALTAFILITILMLLVYKLEKRRNENEEKDISRSGINCCNS